MIRRMEKGDRQAYLVMADAFYSTDAVLKKIPRESIETTFEGIVSGTPFAECFMLLAPGGETAGYALLSHSFSQEAGGRVVWVEELYVRPAFRGRGLAREFFRYLKKNYGGKAKRFRLDVDADNKKAIGLYRELGFEPLPYKQMVIDF